MKLKDERVSFVSALITQGKRLSAWIDSWKWSSLLKLFILIIIILLFVLGYNSIQKQDFSSIINSPQTVKTYENSVQRALTSDREELAQKDSILYNKSGNIEENVNKYIVLLSKELNTDRDYVILFHDNETNKGGSHFKYFTMCFEQPNYERNQREIADDYRRKMTSLYQICSYLVRNDSFYGTKEQMKSIDHRFANALDNEGIEWTGMRLLRKSTGKEIGFIAVSWSKENLKYKPDDEEIRNTLNRYADRIEALYDID